MLEHGKNILPIQLHQFALVCKCHISTVISTLQPLSTIAWLHHSGTTLVMLALSLWSTTRALCTSPVPDCTCRGPANTVPSPRLSPPFCCRHDCRRRPHGSTSETENPAAGNRETASARDRVWPSNIDRTWSDEMTSEFTGSAAKLEKFPQCLCRCGPAEILRRAISSTDGRPCFPPSKSLIRRSSTTFSCIRILLPSLGGNPDIIFGLYVWNCGSEVSA